MYVYDITNLQSFNELTQMMLHKPAIIVGTQTDKSHLRQVETNVAKVQLTQAALIPTIGIR